MILRRRAARGRRNRRAGQVACTGSSPSPSKLRRAGSYRLVLRLQPGLWYGVVSRSLPIRRTRSLPAAPLDAHRAVCPFLRHCCRPAVHLRVPIGQRAPRPPPSSGEAWRRARAQSRSSRQQFPTLVHARWCPVGLRASPGVPAPKLVRWIPARVSMQTRSQCPCVAVFTAPGTDLLRAARSAPLLLVDALAELVLLLADLARRVGGGKVLRLVEGADLNLGVGVGHRVGTALHPLHRFVHRLHLPEPIAGNQLLGLG